MRTSAWMMIVMGAGLAAMAAGCQRAEGDPASSKANTAKTTEGKEAGTSGSARELAATPGQAAGTGRRDETAGGATGAGVKYRGVFVYPGQHQSARRAAGSGTSEVEFAKVVSEDVKNYYGGNTVVVAGNPVRPGSKPGVTEYEEIVRAYAEAGMYVVIYAQGGFFYRGSTGEKWTDAEADRFIAEYLAYLHRFDDLGDKVAMTIISEEAWMWDTHNGEFVERVVSPRLRQIWKAVKKDTRWPVGTILNGHPPFCRAFAELPDEERPNVYLAETYEPTYRWGKSFSGTPRPEEILSGKFEVKPMLEACRQDLANAEEILRGKCEVGHVPFLAGMPAGETTGKGWEHPLVLGYYRPQVEMFKGKYQLGWLYASVNNSEGPKYLGLRDREFKVTEIGKELEGVWKAKDGGK